MHFTPWHLRLDQFQVPCPVTPVAGTLGSRTEGRTETARTPHPQPTAWHHLPAWLANGFGTSLNHILVSHASIHRYPRLLRHTSTPEPPSHHLGGHVVPVLQTRSEETLNEGGTETTVQSAGREGGSLTRAKGGTHVEMAGDVTWGAENNTKCRTVTSETYVLLSTNVTPIKSIQGARGGVAQWWSLDL